MNASKIKQLKNQVAVGDGDEVIEYLLTQIEKIPKKKVQREVRLLSQRWQQLATDERMGVLPAEELSLQRNVLNKALLDLLDQLSQLIKPSPKRNLYLFILLGLFFMVVVVWQLLRVNNFFETPTDPLPPTQDTTVTVPTEQPASAMVTDLKDSTTTFKPEPKAKKIEEAVPTIENIKPKKVEELQIQCATNMGSTNLKFQLGESLELYYQVNKPCFVRVIYEQADGQLVLLRNSVAVKAEDINKRLTLGVFGVTPPLGKEKLFCFAQSEPFPSLTTHWEGDREFIDEGLSPSLKKTRGLKKKVFLAEDQLDILISR